MTRKERRWLMAAVIFSLTIRCALSVMVWVIRHDLAAFHTPDSARYLQLAASLAAGEGFGLDGVPELFRVPGLPLLIAGASWVTPPTPGTLGLQAILGAATTCLCFLAGRRVAGVTAGLCAAWLYALEPGQWVWSSMVLTETLFTFLMAAMLLMAITYLQTGGRAPLLWAVAAAAACAYVRVIGYVLPVVVVALCAVLARRFRSVGPRRNVWRDAAAGVAVATMLLGMWHVRNGVRTGYWGFSTQFERALYFVGGGSLQARTDGTYLEAVVGLHRRIEDQGARTPSEVASEMRRAGFSRVAKDPLAFVSTYVAGMGTTMLHPGSGAFLRLFVPDISDTSPSVTQMITLARWDDARRLAAQKGSTYWIVTLPLGLSTIAYLVLFAMGAWAGRSSPLVLIPVFLVASLVLCSGGPDGDSRRRAPLVPLLSVVAGTGLRARVRGGIEGASTSSGNFFSPC